MTSVEQVNSNKKIVALIKAATTLQGKFRDKVQEAAIAIIVHAQEYGDCTNAKVLARAVSPRERNSLIGYFMMFSPIGVKMGDTAKDDKSRFIKADSKAYNDFNVEGAKSHNWWDDPAGVNPEPKALDTTSDFFKMIEAFLDREMKKAEKDGDKAKYTPEHREEVKNNVIALKDMIGTYRAKQIAAKAAQKPAVTEVPAAPVLPVGAAA